MPTSVQISSHISHQLKTSSKLSGIVHSNALEPRWKRVCKRFSHQNAAWSSEASFREWPERVPCWVLPSRDTKSTRRKVVSTSSTKTHQLNSSNMASFCLGACQTSLVPCWPSLFPDWRRQMRPREIFWSWLIQTRFLMGKPYKSRLCDKGWYKHVRVVKCTLAVWEHGNS